jgi:hypothetical protein
MVWNISPGNKYKDQSAVIPFAGTIRKKYELYQKCHFIYISRSVAIKKERKKES